jgi:hypothetical protein
MEFKREMERPCILFLGLAFVGLDCVLAGGIYIYIYFGVFLFFMISFSIDIQEKVRP